MKSPSPPATFTTDWSIARGIIPFIMKMSSQETNIPIQVQDKTPERLELAGLRTAIDDEFRGEHSGLGEQQSQGKTASTVGKKSQDICLHKGTQKGEASHVKAKDVPTNAGTSLMETHDSGSPVNAKNAQPNNLKRKRENGSYEDDIRNTYGFDNTAATEKASCASVAPVTRTEDDDHSRAMPPPKRFRYMRRNSFVIHRRKGRFSGIGLAIDTVSREHQVCQPNPTPVETCFSNIGPPVEVGDGGSQSDRLSEFTNGPTSCTKNEKYHE